MSVADEIVRISPTMRCRRLATAVSSHFDGVPMREYIQQMLYAPKDGYFSNPVVPVMSHAQLLRFSTFETRAEYERHVAATFAGAQQHGWSTPSELFSPYLGRAVANRICARAVRDESPVMVVEFGGGRGTLAKDILSHIEIAHPSVYHRVEYHLVDISEQLSQRQKSTVAKWGSKTSVHCSHARDWLRSTAPSIAVDKQAHVLAFELLDNLPHDLVRFGDDGQQIGQAYMDKLNGQPSLQWHDTIDSKTMDALLDFELYQHQQQTTIFDAIRRLIDGGVNHVWVPTILHEILTAICENLPDASVTLADFSSFPGALPHTNGPVIQRVERGIAKLYQIEEAPWGEVDIMFPTDFGQLQRTYRTIWEKYNKGEININVLSQQQFYREYAGQSDVIDSTCGDGYNPILQDFANANVFQVDKANEVK